MKIKKIVRIILLILIGFLFIQNFDGLFRIDSTSFFIGYLSGYVLQILLVLYFTS